jgi:hypothetical protein
LPLSFTLSKEGYSMGASQSCAVLPRHTFLHKICQMLWLREGLKIEDYLSENKISKGGDILRNYQLSKSMK